MYHTIWHQYLLSFSKKASTKVCKVTGDMVNRGAGYGLEIPCVYMYMVLHRILNESNVYYRKEALYNNNKH